jgi:heavy metal sensor kinase
VIESVRARLALWHTAVVAALLVAFAGAAYAFLADTVHRRADRFLEESARAFAADVVAERDDEPTNAAAVRASVFEFRFRDLTFVVYDASGRVAGASLGAPSLDTAAVRRAASDSAASRDARFATVPDDEGGVRVFVLPIALGGAPMTVAAAASLHDEAELLESVRTAMAVIIPIVLVAAWAGGYALARRSLAPVVAMSDRAAAIGATSLDDRLPVANPRDELGQLARTFNGLIDRMAAAFEQQRRFMSDASHELRTPVAIMRGEADVALSRDDRAAEEYRDALRIVRGEGRRLSGIVNDLFLLARADAGQQPLRTADLYLDDLLADCARAMRSLAAQRGVDLRLEPPAPHASDYALRADEDLLRRLFLNLLDNAIKYSGPAASVRVSLASHDGRYRVTVADTGPGIPADARAHVFERFYRAEAARSRASGSETGGGAGLGLSIARWIAEAHGGSLALEASSGAGSTFAVTMPAPTLRHSDAMPATSAPAAASGSS